MNSHGLMHPAEHPATIGCATPETRFRNRVESIARRVGWDFWNVEHFPDLLQKCTNWNANCIIIDLVRAIPTSPEESNVGVFGVLPPAIFIVEKGNVSAAISATRAGAVSVLEKPVDQDDLSKNIEIAVQLDQRSRKNGVDGRFQHSRYSEFTCREKLILGMLVDGMKNSAVASRLDVSLRTVEAERAQILKKLDVGSFVQLIRLVAKLEYETRTQRIREFERLLSVEDQPH